MGFWRLSEVYDFSSGEVLGVETESGIALAACLEVGNADGGPG